MGTFQIGRVGLENTTGEVHGWSSGGNGIKVSGHTQYGSVPEALVVREQLLGYVEQPDEAFVPVTWSEQPEVDGFYRVRSVDVDSPPDTAAFGVLDWSLDLERVRGFATPLIEDVVLGKQRPTTHGFVAKRMVSITNSAKSVVEFVNSAATTTISAVQKFGDGVVMNSLQPSADQRVSIQYYVAPSRFYEGAATLRVGDPQRIVVGRQVPNAVGTWSIANGLLEVAANPVDDKVRFRFRMFDTENDRWGKWDGAYLMAGDVANSTTGRLSLHSMTVKSNSPERVTVRLLATYQSQLAVTIDISLRRGARYAECRLNSVRPQFFSLGVSSFPGAVSVSSGYVSDFDGAWSLVGSPVTVGKLPSSGDGSLGIRPSESGSADLVSEWSFGIGRAPYTTGAGPTYDDHIRALNEYQWAGNEKQTVVSQ